MGFTVLQALKGDLEIQALRVSQGCQADMVQVSKIISGSPSTVSVSLYLSALTALGSSSPTTPYSLCMQMRELMDRTYRITETFLTKEV